MHRNTKTNIKCKKIPFEFQKYFSGRRNISWKETNKKYRKKIRYFNKNNNNKKEIAKKYRKVYFYFLSPFCSNLWNFNDVTTTKQF